MPFTRGHFLKHRPWLYHFTTPDNVDLLRRGMAMHSAAELVKRANRYRVQVATPDEFLGQPRLDRMTLQIGPDLRVTLNDQRPLRHEAGFHDLRGTHADFVRCLNGYVFFWPGTADGPKPKGDLAKTFQARYAAFGCVRVPAAEAWTEGTPIQFCRYNSGAPQARDGVTRGSHIFVTCEEKSLRVRLVAEVVFLGSIPLPLSTQWRPPGAVEWQALFPGGRADESIRPDGIAGFGEEAH